MSKKSLAKLHSVSECVEAIEAKKKSSIISTVLCLAVVSGLITMVPLGMVKLIIMLMLDLVIIIIGRASVKRQYNEIEDILYKGCNPACYIGVLEELSNRDNKFKPTTGMLLAKARAYQCLGRLDEELSVLKTIKPGNKEKAELVVLIELFGEYYIDNGEELEYESRVHQIKAIMADPKVKDGVKEIAKEVMLLWKIRRSLTADPARGCKLCEEHFALDGYPLQKVLDAEMLVKFCRVLCDKEGEEKYLAYLKENGKRIKSIIDTTKVE